MNQPQYLFEARSKPSLPWHEVPLIRATQGSVKGYGSLVHDPAKFDIAITRWPQQGWRPIDQGTGDEGGFVEGTFCCDWKGDVLYGKNDAVSGHYVLGRSTDPQHAQTMEQTKPRDQVLLWHMNYHPDGGGNFFSARQEAIHRAGGSAGRQFQPRQSCRVLVRRVHGLIYPRGHLARRGISDERSSAFSGSSRSSPCPRQCRHRSRVWCVLVLPAARGQNQAFLTFWRVAIWITATPPTYS